MYRLEHTDCFEWLRNCPAHSVQAVCTDPPYGILEFTEKELAKMRAGRGGVWRLPPKVGGSQRDPLPRFTILTEDQKQHLRDYKIGDLIGVKDPKTNASATRNIFRDNIPLHPGLTYEEEMAKNGVIMVACNMALTVLSSMAAPKANVTPETAKTEFTAGLLPGVNLSASGVYAVNRAQAAGCSYAFAG